jgi:hypothetical protein
MLNLTKPKARIFFYFYLFIFGATTIISVFSLFSVSFAKEFIDKISLSGIFFIFSSVGVIIILDNIYYRVEDSIKIQKILSGVGSLSFKKSPVKIYFNTELSPFLWEKFSRDFKSYNDPWITELENPTEYIKTHKERYKNKDFGRFKFLFFIQENDLNPYEKFERFVRFQAMVHLGMDIDLALSGDFKQHLESELNKRRMKRHSLPLSLNHILVYFNFKKIPNQTFFRGYKGTGKDQERICFWYLSADDTTNKPYMIFELKNNNGWWKNLDSAWDRAAENTIRIDGIKIFDEYLNRISNSGKTTL